MKFYHNGKLIRTSSHEYTYAVIDTKNNDYCRGCRTSFEAAQSIITSEINRYMNGIENAERKIEAIKSGKSTYIAKYGRTVHREHIDPKADITGTQEWLDGAKKAVDHIKKYWVIVELERR